MYEYNSVRVVVLCNKVPVRKCKVGEKTDHFKSVYYTQVL